MNKVESRKKRIRRVRAKIRGTAKQRPRLSVFRSASHIYAQLVDDDSGKTLASFDSRKLKKTKNNLETAAKVGEEIGKIAKGMKIETVLFDRRGYKYHGRIKALADGVRESGIKF